MEFARREIPIVAIDKSDLAFLDRDGNRYYEVACDVFAKQGDMSEGVVGYHGSGSHGGHIVLKPFYRFAGNNWVRL